jgi:hypothetical protein
VTRTVTLPHPLALPPAGRLMTVTPLPGLPPSPEPLDGPSESDSESDSEHEALRPGVSAAVMTVAANRALSPSESLRVPPSPYEFLRVPTSSSESPTRTISMSTIIMMTVAAIMTRNMPWCQCLEPGPGPAARMPRAASGPSLPQCGPRAAGVRHGDFQARAPTFNLKFAKGRASFKFTSDLPSRTLVTGRSASNVWKVTPGAARHGEQPTSESAW